MECNSCDLFPRVEQLEKNYRNYDSVHHNLESKIDKQANLYTSLSIRVEETAKKVEAHMADSKERDTKTHQVLDKIWDELGNHMKEEASDRKDLLSTLDKLSTAINENDKADIKTRFKVNLMWAGLGVITTAILAGLGTMLWELYKTGLILQGG